MNNYEVYIFRATTIGRLSLTRPQSSLSLSLLGGVRGDGKKESEGERVFLPFSFPSPPAPVARVTQRRLGTSQPLSSLN